MNPCVLASQLRRWAGLRFASLHRLLPEGSLLLLDTAVPAHRDRSTWCCALPQLPGQPSRSPPWGTRSLGAPLDAPRGRGRSASTATLWRFSLLRRSPWCRVRLLSPPPRSDEPLCSPRWNSRSLGASPNSPSSRGQPASSPGPWTARGSSSEASSVPPSLCLARSAGSLCISSSGASSVSRANASVGQLARLPRPLRAQPQL
jgi:hypothetical protein